MAAIVAGEVAQSVSFAGQSSFTVSVNRQAGESLIIGILSAYQYGPAGAVVSVVWDAAGDNQAFTLLDAGPGGDTRRLDVFALIAPTSAKTGLVTVNYGGATSEAAFVIIRRISGGDVALGSAMIRAHKLESKVGFKYNVPATTTLTGGQSGDLALDFIYARQTPESLTMGSGQTGKVLVGTDGQSPFLVSSTKAGASSVTMTWNLTAETVTSAYDAAHAIVSIASAAGGGGGDGIAPTISSASVSNGSPTVVTLTASETLDGAYTPAASAFTVSGHSVTAVSVSGASIALTVTPAFASDEASRTVAYTQPGTNNVRDAAGNLMANFSGMSVTNNVTPSDSVAPIFSSAQVTNSQRTVIQITMSESLISSIPPNSAFTASGGRAVSSVSISGAVVSVTVSPAYANGDVITIGYTQPGSNPRLQDGSGNLTASFTPKSVTNNITNSNTASLPWPTKPDGVSIRPLAPKNGTPRTTFSYRVAIYNADTDALVLVKTGQTTNAVSGLPQAITGEAALVAGTWYRRNVISEADRTVIGVDTMQAV